MTERSEPTAANDPPLPGPASATASKSAAPRDERLDEKSTIAKYFHDNGTSALQAHKRWRNGTAIARALTVALGLILFMVPVVLAWLEHGEIGGALFASIAERPDFLIPAVPMILIGLVPHLWRFGWELPAGLLLLIFAGEMLLFQPNRPRMTVALSVLALCAIGYGVYLRLKRQHDPADLKDVEKEVDAATDKVLKRAVEKALKDAPFPADYSPSAWQILRTIPERDRLGSLKFQCFVGHDKRPRITPLGFAAFNYRENGLAVVQGAVDLTKEQVLFTDAQELAYSEIHALHWSQVAPPDDAGHEKAAQPVADDQAPAADSQPHTLIGGAGASGSSGGRLSGFRRGGRRRHVDSLSISVADQPRIVLVFHDSEALDGGVGRNSIETIERIREVWTAISNKRLALAGGGRSAS
ncbi:MAG: hypothetical protein RLZ98_457 [Pseudomonadota bacterium]|jgi:hypothetical protein